MQTASPVTPSALRAPDDAVLAYKVATLVRGEDPAAPELVALRARIADSPIARALLGHRRPDGTIERHGAYRKWQGPHWTLVGLATIDYPPGDRTLMPLVEQVHEWLFAPAFLQPPSTAIYEGQEDRVRHCGSQDGNAVWYAVRLGLADERTVRLVERLLAWQWPDGGWNCDKRLEARSSSFQETAIPARGLWAYGVAFDDPRARDAAQRAAELLLSRQLLWRRHGGGLIRPEWGGAFERIHWPIQFYDVLFVLQVMTELGLIGDPRCGPALDLLASKRLPDGGFPVDLRNAARATTIASRATWADWGPGGPRTSNPLVTVLTEGVLAAARRNGQGLLPSVEGGQGEREGRALAGS